MKKIKKRLVVFIALAIMAIPMFMSNVFAAGPNNKDTDFDFTTRGNYLHCHGDWFRDKRDSSAPYVYLTTASGQIDIRIVSAVNKNGDGATDATKGVAYMKKGEKRRIRCSVKDVGRVWCTVGVKTPTNQYLKGVWSPDSVGTYPYAN